jgi:hypothetical protein
MPGTSEPASRSFHILGLAGWVVIVGVALAWEGLGLAFSREGWPSVSDLLRTVSRPVVGRWIVLGLWLWLGWHLFVRGWQPLLRGTPPRSEPATAALSFGLLIRQVVVPLGLTYVAFVGAMALQRRAPSRVPTVEAAAHDPRTHPRALVRHVAVTLAAGYVVYLVLVMSYYAIVAYQSPQFLRAAVSGGAFITFAVALPGLLLFSGAEALVRRRSNR